MGSHRDREDIQTRVPMGRTREHRLLSETRQAQRDKLCQGPPRGVALTETHSSKPGPGPVSWCCAQSLLKSFQQGTKALGRKMSHETPRLPVTSYRETDCSPNSTPGPSTSQWQAGSRDIPRYTKSRHHWRRRPPRRGEESRNNADVAPRRERAPRRGSHRQGQPQSPRPRRDRAQP